MRGLPASVGRGSEFHGADVCCAAAGIAAANAAITAAAGIQRRIASSERLQHCLGAGDVELTRLFDVQCLDDAVIDQHGVTL